MEKILSLGQTDERPEITQYIYKWLVEGAFTQIKNTALPMPRMVTLQTAEQMRDFGKIYTNYIKTNIKNKN